MTSIRPAAAVVLAAGGGIRMKSSTAKVLHRAGGRTLLAHALAAARGAEPERVVVVVRHDREAVERHLAELGGGVLVAEQDDEPGTGRAAECALAALPHPVRGTVLVTMADVPLLSGETLQALLERHAETGAQATLLTARLADPSGYGRVLRDPQGHAVAIVEERDANPDQRGIDEVNAGCYAFDGQALVSCLAGLDRDNAQGERYLTDVVAAVVAGGGRVATYEVDDTWQTEGVNDRVQLARVAAELNRRTLTRWMLDGVTVVDPATTWVDVGATLGGDVVLHPNTQLLGSTSVGDRSVVGPNATLTDVSVGRGATVLWTHAVGAVIGDGAEVGPFASLRPGTRIGPDGKVGTFVETKNADIAAAAKVPHLSYVGDADVGEGSNIGAGTIFANYDGVAKHHTTVGAHCRTGANNTFVAPVSIGDGAATGAGTVVRRPVPPGALAVSGGPQREVRDWVLRKRAGTPAAAAAEEAIAAGDEEGRSR